jgi:hypothetical protein
MIGYRRTAAAVAARFQADSSPVQLGEMSDELHGGIALAKNEGLEARKEHVVRQRGNGRQHVLVHDLE